MKRADGRPSVWPPIVVSLIALSALNIVLANWIAGQVSPQASSLPTTVIGTLVVLTAIFAVAAVVLWRRYAS
jgi:hypothetical protein